MNPQDTVQAYEEVGAGEEETTPARGLPSPTQPTRKEIQEHVLTHLPHRSWCGHGSTTKREHVVPIVSIDCSFCGYLDKRKQPIAAKESHEARVTCSTIMHIACGGNNGRTSGSAGHARKGCRRRRDRRKLLRWTGADEGMSNFITQTANFPLIAP